MLFISQTLPYSFGACVRNTPKIVTFVIGKLKMVFHITASYSKILVHVRIAYMYMYARTNQ